LAILWEIHLNLILRQELLLLQVNEKSGYYIIAVFSSQLRYF
jgi:hypothetical protein